MRDLGSSLAPPKHLSAPARALWRRILDQHVIDDAVGRALLQQLCEATDGLQQCQQRIKQDGLMMAGRPHPLLRVEAEYRRAIFAATRALKLDVVTSQE